MSYGERTNKDARVPGFCEHRQLLPEGEPNTLGEDVIIIQRDLLEQSTVNGDQCPKGGPTVRVQQREKVRRCTVIFTSPIGLETEQRLPVFFLFRCRGSSTTGDPRAGQVFLRDIYPPKRRVFLHIADDVGELKGDAKPLCKILRFCVAVSEDVDADQPNDRRDVITVPVKI